MPNALKYKKHSSTIKSKNSGKIFSKNSASRISFLLLKISFKKPKRSSVSSNFSTLLRQECVLNLLAIKSVNIVTYNK